MCSAALGYVHNSIAAKMDAQFISAVKTSRVNEPTRKQRLDQCHAIAREYNSPQYFASPDTFVPEPPAPDLALKRLRSLKAGAAFDARWLDGFSALHPDMHDHYFAFEQSKHSHTRLLLHNEPRPAIILLHGYLGGAFWAEEFILAAKRWYRLGFDVALGLLPFHGHKRIPTEKLPLFPGKDARFTVECCRQGVHDVRTLTSYFLRHGAPRVGVMGMSLGGYVSSLAATIESRLTFCVPIIPFASFAELARDRGTLGDNDADFEEFLARREAERSVSPLARPSLVKSTLVLAAKADRVTPLRHAEMLARHFKGDLHVFAGGHILQTWRSRAYSTGERWLSAFL